MSLANAAGLLCAGEYIRVPHDLGTVEALPVVIDLRGRVPVMVVRTAAGREMPVPIHRLPVGGAR